jgi:hypothetical protein
MISPIGKTQTNANVAVNIDDSIKYLIYGSTNWRLFMSVAGHIEALMIGITRRQKSPYTAPGLFPVCSGLLLYCVSQRLCA